MTIASKAVCGQRRVAWVGVKPWPADRDASSDGFALSVKGFLACKNDRILAMRRETGDMSTMEGDTGLGVLIGDIKKGVIYMGVFNVAKLDCRSRIHGNALGNLEREIQREVAMEIKKWFIERQ